MSRNSLRSPSLRYHKDMHPRAVLVHSTHTLILRIPPHNYLDRRPSRTHHSPPEDMPVNYTPRARRRRRHI